MKKIIVLFMSILLFTAVLAGCGGNNLTIDETKVGEDGYLGSTSNDSYEYDVFDTHIRITKYIGQEAQVTVPEKIDDKFVTHIGNRAFIDTAQELVTKITLPSSISDIHDYAFYGAMALQEIALDSANLDFTVVDGVLFTKDMTKIICYPQDKPATSFEIPASVKSLGGSNFAMCTHLESVTIPDTVTSIGDYAFQGCTALVEMVIPDGVTRMGSTVFLGCTSLQTLTLPKHLQQADESIVWNCTALKEIKGYEGTPAEEIAASAGVEFVSLGSIDAVPTEPSSEVA